jgi:Protein of unknown function (DUF1173)
MIEERAPSDDEGQRFAIRGRVWGAGDLGLQEVLALVHDTPERPRCLCVPGGVEMYVARHRRYLVKRMPDTGQHHAAGCPSFEPDAAQSGLGALVGEAVIEREPGRVELRVEFPWTRVAGHSSSPAESMDRGEVEASRHRMSLRAVMHYLFERAGFNRWTPAMTGKRNQGVLHKYLSEAASEIVVKGLPMSDRLYVPEPFTEAAKADTARRRREKLAVLQPHDGQAPLALVIGELKIVEAHGQGRRIWIRHMPDAPLLATERLWQRFERTYAAALEARDADLGHRVRLILAALIRARREFTYEIDAASLMMLSEHWIPVEGIHELPLIDALVGQGRRFIKPLRYDAPCVDAFANALLIDAGSEAVPLHLVSAFMDAKRQAAKERSIASSGATAWVWAMDQAMPPLPTRAAPAKG